MLLTSWKTTVKNPSQKVNFKICIHCKKIVFALILSIASSRYMKSKCQLWNVDFQTPTSRYSFYGFYSSGLDIWVLDSWPEGNWTLEYWFLNICLWWLLVDASLLHNSSWSQTWWSRRREQDDWGEASYRAFCLSSCFFLICSAWRFSFAVGSYGFHFKWAGEISWGYKHVNGFNHK